MNEELYFNDELRKCLNAAGLSDCGENDAWNYWYHRVHKAHDQAVDRVTEVQRAENAKLRELVRDMYGFIERMDEECGDVTFSDCFDYCKHDATDDGCCKTGECWYEQRMRDLGVEVDA